MTSTDQLFERAAAGAPLSTDERDALCGATDLLALGMAADEVRRRKHGRRMTFVRVAELDVATIDVAAIVVPPSAGEVRLTGEPRDWAAVPSLIQAVAAATAGRVPITGFSGLQLETASAGDRGRLRDLLASCKEAGLTAIDAAPVDAMGAPETLFETGASLGLGVTRITVEGARGLPPSSLIALLAEQVSLARASVVAPLPARPNPASPSTGYEDVRLVALARVLIDVDHVQVDWAVYGPKLAQVALTFGADDVDRVSALDDTGEGRRRAPLEEIRRNIVAAGGEPVERDGLFRPRA